MEIRITSGTTVNRVWGDATEELVAAFQYEYDAVAFAKTKVLEDEKREFSCFYLVCNSYNGHVTIIRGKSDG